MIWVNFATIGGGIALMLLMKWQLGLIYLAGAAPALALSWRARSRYRVLARRSQDQVGDLGTTIEVSV